MVANKIKFSGNQEEADDLVEIAKLESAPIFKQQFSILKESIEKCNSLEEMKELLEDEEKVTQICKEMQNEKFNKLLKGSLLNAYLIGRSKSDE